MSLSRIYAILLTAGLLYGITPEDRALTAVQSGLTDGNPTKRISAVRSLNVVKAEPREVKMIESALKDKDSGVRAAACTTLGDIKSRESIPLLQQTLDDKAPEVVFAAAKALYALGDPSGAQVLTEILLGDQKGSSGFVSTSLRDAKLKLHEPRALIMVGVKEASGLLGPFGASVPVAEQILKDNQASGKTVAALLLATDNSPESKQAFKLALEDKNWTVRSAAARAIALRELVEFYPDVAALLDDKHEEVRSAAAASMIRLRQSAPKSEGATEQAAALVK